MAYISAEEVAVIRADLKKAFPTYKFSVRKQDSSSVNVSIMKSDLELNWTNNDGDPITGGYMGVNHYHMDTCGHPAKTIEVLNKIIAIVSKEHWDKSDSMTDYFHCAFYMRFSIGTYSKAYEHLEPKAPKAKRTKKVKEPAFDELEAIVKLSSLNVERAELALQLAVMDRDIATIEYMIEKA